MNSVRQTHDRNEMKDWIWPIFSTQLSSLKLFFGKRKRKRPKWQAASKLHGSRMVGMLVRVSISPSHFLLRKNRAARECHQKHGCLFFFPQLPPLFLHRRSQSLHHHLIPQSHERFLHAFAQIMAAARHSFFLFVQTHHGTPPLPISDPTSIAERLTQVKKKRPTS